MSTPRNVIILHSDEMRGDCVGFAGHRTIATPHLDAFARHGVVLRKHFTVHGKCVPSRVAMMSGRYAHTDAIRTVNETNLIPTDRPDLMKTLRGHGYQTAVFGHNHCWDDFWGGNIPGKGAVDWHSFTEGEFPTLLKQTWPVPTADAPRRLTGLNDGHDWIGLQTQPLTGFCDDNRAAQAVHFLTRVRDRTRPFFLQLNLSAPHPQYRVEEPYYSRHRRETISLPPTDLPRNASLPLRAQRRCRTGEIADEAALREVHGTYLGMIEKVDTLMGRVLDAIAAEGLFDDSIVIFTSDHGDFAGQYGLCEKYDTVLADCLLRVPCIISAPGLPTGAISDGLSEHIDLPDTILELLGIAAPPPWVRHGRSLVPQLRGGPGAEAVFADGGHEAAMRRRFNRPVMHLDPHTGRETWATAGKQRTYREEPDSMARAKMVRTERWKLVVRETGGDELYDLVADPWEMDNRFGEPALASVQSELMTRIVRWSLHTDPDMPFQDDVGA